MLRTYSDQDHADTPTTPPETPTPAVTGDQRERSQNPLKLRKTHSNCENRVKSNQPKLLARITALPWAEVPTTATDDSRGHGRVETRTLQILTAARGIGFPYAKQVVRITRERLIVTTGQRSVEVVYAICSLPFEHARPTAIATWLRQHWGIENSVHWVRDVTFDEDRHTAHTGGGAQTLATLRNTAINLHRLNGADNIAEACRVTALTANRRLDLLNPKFPSSQAC